MSSKETWQNIWKYGLGVLILLLVVALLFPLGSSDVTFCDESLSDEKVRLLQSDEFDCATGHVRISGIQMATNSTQFDRDERKQSMQKCKKMRKCVTCPHWGSCDADGKMVCDTGFRREGNDCVENEELRQQGEKILNSFERQLQQLLGKYQCGQEETYQVSYLDFLEILQ